MFANQIKALMRKLGYKKVILVGFSLGGMIVRKFAHVRKRFGGSYYYKFTS